MQNENTRKLKPFDLEAAKRGDPVVTREGLTVRIICFDRKGDDPIVFLITSHDGSREWIYTADKQGRVVNLPNRDLFMAPKKKYLNIYRDFNFPDGFMVTEFNDKETADKCQNPDGSRLACVEIEE
jgi:hypothetical protein